MSIPLVHIFLLNDFSNPGDTTPPMNWKENEVEHVFEIDLPGLSKQEVKLQIHQGSRVIHVNGDRKVREENEKEKEDHVWHYKERLTTHGSFSRRFRLPENANLDQIKAKMENGVLTIVIPKLLVGEGGVEEAMRVGKKHEEELFKLRMGVLMVMDLVDLFVAKPDCDWD